MQLKTIIFQGVAAYLTLASGLSHVLEHKVAKGFKVVTIADPKTSHCAKKKTEGSVHNLFCTIVGDATIKMHHQIDVAS